MNGTVVKLILLWNLGIFFKAFVQDSWLHAIKCPLEYLEQYTAFIRRYQCSSEIAGKGG